MKTTYIKYFAVSLIALLLPKSINAQTSGQCGDNLSWSYNTTADSLIITGTGAMYDYTSSTQPWNDFRSTITAVDLSSGLTTIGQHAFDSFRNLTSITIPEGVTSIGSYAFHLCALTSVSIPSTVSSIGNRAFYYNDDLQSVTVGNPIPVTISEYTFANRANATLYVPYGAKAAYEAANVWKNFGTIVETAPSGNVDLVDGTPYTYSGEAVEMETITYSRTYKNTSWQPWYVPFDIELTTSLLSQFSFARFAGTYTEEDGTFYLTIVRLSAGEVIKANIPYFVKAKTADSNNAQTFTVENTRLYPAESTSLIMLSAENKVTVTGIYETKTVTEEDKGWYAYSGGKYSQQNKIGNKLNPFRFFVEIEDRADSPYSVTPNPNEVKLKVLGEDEETGIAEVKSEELRVKKNDAIYDLQGRRVETPTKGIYIVNGKKVLVK